LFLWHTQIDTQRSFFFSFSSSLSFFYTGRHDKYRSDCVVLVSI
jgi:hypothetical protein